MNIKKPFIESMCSLRYDVRMTMRHPTASSTTLSIRLASTLKTDLDRLARATKQTKSFLAAAAVEAYVARELEIIEGIERGLVDTNAGRVVPHEQVATEVLEAIEAITGRSPRR